MRTPLATLAALAAVAALGPLATVAGCSRHGGTDDRAARVDPAQPIPLAAVTVDELADLLARKDAQPVDANTDQTRRRMGVIPGAVLLGDADSLDKLPADKARGLVFYCANDACSASHHAARKAIAAGYARVKILPVGIAGWVKAGKPTAQI